MSSQKKQKTADSGTKSLQQSLYFVSLALSLESEYLKSYNRGELVLKQKARLMAVVHGHGVKKAIRQDKLG